MNSFSFTIQISSNSFTNTTEMNDINEREKDDEEDDDMKKVFA